MPLFWRQGYCGTSMRDLTAATRLKPGSLYGAFDSKRALFNAALDSYFTMIRKRVDETLHAEGSASGRVRGFFDALLDDMACDKGNKGCLMVNTLLEIPAEDEELNRHISGMFVEVENAFYRVLREGKNNGELAPDKDARVLARLLMTGIYGLRVYNKTRPSLRNTREVVKQLLTVLD